jgi:hypothetical protein
MQSCCAVMDLRQYTLHPGRRDTLIELFDSAFVEGQEVHGMHISGQFRDLDHSDRFVWLRGFPDLAARADALTRFYSGPVWQAHQEAANATMVDSDNALLLKPVDLRPAYPTPEAPRPAIGGTQLPRSVVAGAVYHRASSGDGFVDFFRNEVEPILAATGAQPAASFETLAAGNNFPALPLRNETVFAWFAVFPDPAAHDEHRRTLSSSPTWQDKVMPEITRRSIAPPQDLRLSPTARSQFR